MHPAVTVHQHPSANSRDMKAEGFDPLFTNPHTTWYILSPTSLFAALKKSDREASQLAPSVPLLSYRGAAGCAGLKSSHWWAVLYRAKALLSNWRGPAARWFPLDYGCYCARRLLIPLQSVLAPFLFLVSWWASSLLAVLKCIYFLSSWPQLRPFSFMSYASSCHLVVSPLSPPYRLRCSFPSSSLHFLEWAIDITRWLQAKWPPNPAWIHASSQFSAIKCANMSSVRSHRPPASA